jgi:hypothetical protein
MKAKQVLSVSAAAAGVAAALAVGPVFGAAIPPAKGLYGSFDYVDSTSGTGCTLSKGEVFSGHLDWPGSGKTGAIWRYQDNPPATSGPVVEKITFPTTPKATSTHWSGTESHVFAPPSTSLPPFTGIFVGTLTYIDSASFVLERSVTIGKCTLEIFSAFVAE